MKEEEKTVREVSSISYISWKGKKRTRISLRARRSLCGMACASWMVFGPRSLILSPERTSVHPVGGCIFIRLPSIFPVKEPFLLRPFERNLESGRTGPLDAIDIRIAGEHAKAGSVTHGYRVFLIPVLVAGQLSEIGSSESDAKDPLTKASWLGRQRNRMLDGYSDLYGKQLGTDGCR